MQRVSNLQGQVVSKECRLQERKRERASLLKEGIEVGETEVKGFTYFRKWRLVLDKSIKAQ